jgi:hypothetical protein
MLMLDAFNPMLAKAMLEAEDLPPLLVFSLLFPSASQPVLAGTMITSIRDTVTRKSQPAHVFENPKLSPQTVIYTRSTSSNRQEDVTTQRLTDNTPAAPGPKNDLSPITLPRQIATPTDAKRQEDRGNPD